MPGVYQLVNGEVNVSKLRNVEIEDLLGREPIKVNLDEILGYIKGKTVLVTGGCGSIGSEICTQLAEHRVGHLVIFDIYENNAYEIQQKLKWEHPELKLTVLIGSVRNAHRINTVMETYHPEVVFHAAAHKHVPLMEDSPNGGDQKQCIWYLQNSMCGRAQPGKEICTDLYRQSCKSD